MSLIQNFLIPHYLVFTRYGPLCAMYHTAIPRNSTAEARVRYQVRDCAIFVVQKGNNDGVPFHSKCTNSFARFSMAVKAPQY